MAKSNRYLVQALQCLERFENDGMSFAKVVEYLKTSEYGVLEKVNCSSSENKYIVTFECEEAGVRQICAFEKLYGAMLEALDSSNKPKPKKTKSAAAKNMVSRSMRPKFSSQIAPTSLPGNH